jgi:hypothetical protein
MKGYKPLLVVVMALLFAAVGLTQRELNRDRDRLELTHTAVLENAPPVLAFTTVALGGFRGIIANILWIRASDLQESGKYFEMVQLADWITKLQPHFTQVWVHQAWNMAYNISVKFPNPNDRWLWVQRGIELLRDQGLVYNRHEVLMYRELAWLYQHKLGAYLDDAHLVYKYEWAKEMSAIFPHGRPDYEALLNPKTDADRQRLAQARDHYKFDPAIMKAVDEEYGPLDWRMPETHAIYWASVGLKEAKLSDKPEAQLITLRRTIYQPLLISVQRGRFVENRVLTNRIDFGPNLEMIPNASKAYEKAMQEDPPMRDHIATAHRNMIRDAIYFLFTHNREKDAQYWLSYGREKYGTNAFPAGLRVEQYALSRLGEDVNETSQDRTQILIEGLLTQYFFNLSLGEDDRAINFERMARLARQNFIARTVNNKSSEIRLKLPEIDTTKREIVRQMLDPEKGLETEMQLQLRTRLGLPAGATNLPPANGSTPAAETPAKSE